MRRRIKSRHGFCFVFLQNMLFEIEQKVSYLSELSVHSESLLLEGRAETKGEAEQLTLKLRSLKDSLVELQQMLQDKQVDIQVRSGGLCVLFPLYISFITSTLHTNVLPFPCFPSSLLRCKLSVLCDAELCINGSIE